MPIRWSTRVDILLCSVFIFVFVVVLSSSPLSVSVSVSLSISFSVSFSVSFSGFRTVYNVPGTIWTVTIHFPFPGEARFITVTRIEGKGRDRADLPPILRLGQARDTALDTYFSYRPPAAVEVDGVMSAAAGGGMHAAAELATQKKHKARRLGERGEK